MTHLNIFAYTAPHSSLPPFISINVEDDGRVMLHVRSSEADGGGQAVAEIPRSQIPDLIIGLQAVVSSHQR